MTFSPTSQEAYRDKSKGAEPHVDFELMLRAWNSGPTGRDLALEIADRNRENARSEK